MSKHSLPRGGRSKRAPYQHGEEWDARHARRLHQADADEDRMRSHLADLEVMISRYNHGAHWKMSAAGMLFEWWPQSARVVIGKAWQKPRKAHDVDQVAALIRRMVGRPGPKS